MRWGEMEILSPSSYFSNSSWFVDDSCWSAARWTPAENKAFENALAVFDENTPDRWHKVAAMVPGKTVGDVIRQYKELEDDVTSIEAGLVPLPGYNATSSSSSISSSSSPFTLEWGGGGHSYRYAGFKQSYGAVGGGRRSSSSVRPPNEHERKKGVPWTEEEHKLFLLGLKKYGKGDWRNISRNFVITRTPTQVASHAQKYFIRQLSGGKDKRRASIHDITTLNLNDNNHTPSPDNNKTQSNFDVAVENHTSKDTTAMGFCSSPYNINSYGLKINGQHQFQRDAMHETSPYIGSQNVVFQMQPGLHYPNA